MRFRTRMKFFLIIIAVALGYASSELPPRPEITVVTTADGFQLSWSPVEATDDQECFVVYIVTHQVNAVNVSNHITEYTELLLPFTPCAHHTFMVVTRCRTGALVADAGIKSISTGISESLQVENLVIIKENDGVGVSWSRPEDSLPCDILYRVTMSNGAGYHDEFYTSQNSHFVPGLTLPPCTSLAITVTPFDSSVFGTPKTVTLLVDAGNSGAIRDLVVNNGRIEWTSVQDNGFCEVIYDITIGNNGDPVTASTTKSFFDAEFVACAIYNVFVTSRIGNTVISALHVNHRARPINVGIVENLQLREVDGQVEANWSPVVIGICEVHYKLRFYINGVQRASALIADTNRRFSTYPCAENWVTVQPTVDMVMGAETRGEMFASSTEPQPVENLLVTATDDSLVVTWSSISVGFCSMVYVVEHVMNGNSLSFTVDTPTAILDRLACTDNEIGVTAVAGSSYGPTARTSIEISVESLPYVEDINLEEVEDGLLVSWSPIVKGKCQILYTISNFDGENTNEYETELTSYTIAKTTCANNTVTIIGVEVNTRVSSSPNYERIDVDIDLAKVRNLEVNRLDDHVLQIDWERPHYSDHCVIEYLVNVRDRKNNNVTFVTPETSLGVEVPMEPCDDFEVTVIPISPVGRKGVVTSKDSIAYLFHVHPVSDLIKHQGAVTWARPYGTGICDIVYRVLVTDETGAIVKEVETSETQINLEMVPCRHYTTEVKAVDVFTNLISETIIVEGVGAATFTEGITNLDYQLTRQTLAVSWTAAAAGDCTIIYDVTHAIENKTSHFIATESSIDLDTVSCSVNFVIVTPVIQEGIVIGEPIADSILVDLDVLERVENIFLGGAINGTTAVRWDPPRYSGNCLLEYQVEIFDSNGLVDSFATEDIFFYRNFVPCNEYVLTITPQHNGKTAETMSFNFLADESAHAAPVHIKTVPSLASANITLQANLPKENSCPIKELRILCDDSIGSEANLDVTILIEDNAQRIFEIGLTNLVHDTHYICKAQWLTPLVSEWGPVFKFITMEIPTRSLDISHVTSNNITISWEVPTGLGRYILYHVVVVTTYGPNHFLPDSCDPVPRNVTETFTVPANVFTFTFTNALPNFRYHIGLITRFDIGVDSESYLAIVDTLPSVPGPIINMGARFEFDICAEWGGPSHFVWTTPCDINGDLERYEVTVTTTYNIAGETKIHTAASTLLATEGLSEYEFVVPIPTINPLFNYSVSINTFAAFPSVAPAKLTDVQPPRAYTACGPF